MTHRSGAGSVVTVERLWRAERADALLAAVMAVIAVGEAVAAPPDKYPRALAIGLAALLAAPLVLRRRAPLVALALVLAVTVVQRLAFGEIWDAGSALAIPFVAVYSVAAHSARRSAVAGYLLTWAVLSVCDMGDGGDSADVAFIGLVYGAIWIAGRMTRRQRDLAEANAAYARDLEGVQAVRAEAAALEERARIARELHDVVAHCVSTMVVQAEAGQALLASDPARAGESFGAIQASGRQALGELRRMLGLLRDGTEATAHLPQPTLAGLEQLVAGVRASGLDVELTETGAPRALSHGLDLSAYRIVQESLTNTLKHAGATRAAVRLAWSDDQLEIEVRDDGQGAQRRNGQAARAGSGTGHGLLGMRERAALHGGRLEAGSLPQGGYAVRARFPLS